MERSAYTEDDFKDYNESSHPWSRQKTPCLADEINHVVCETELKADNASFQNDVDVDGSDNIIQPCCAVDGCGTTTTTFNAMESCGGDVKCTQSQCGDVKSKDSKIAVTDTIDMLGNGERTDSQQNSDEDFETQSVSPCCLCDGVANNAELAGQESSHPHVVTISNTTQENVTHRPQDQADQNNIDLVNGLHTGVLEAGTGSVCPQGGYDTCTPLSRRLFNCQAEGVEEDVTYKLTSTDAKIVGNNFRPKQGNSNSLDWYGLKL